LRPFAGNARVHSKKQIKQIAKSIERFGFNAPVLIGDNREIIAGHGRVEAAKLLGLPTVPTVALSHLSAVASRQPDSNVARKNDHLSVSFALPDLRSPFAAAHNIKISFN